MLTCLKVSSVAYERVFQEVLKCRYDIYQYIRVGDKNRVICLAIMFTSRITVIKISQLAHYLYFLLMTAINASQFEQNI